MQFNSTKTQDSHEHFMVRCLDLAQKGLGQVAPNPLVGAILVLEGQLIAEGFHQQFGGPHAEVNCINALQNKDLLKECTLYVNLEPCSHFGKTPPCANLIVKSGIKKVVVCNLDPNPLVAGRGIALLRDHGIEVITGVLEAEGRWLNRRFFTYQELRRPYIILKWAQSNDGFVDNSRVKDFSQTKPMAITCQESNRLNHKWRAEEQAIMVGKKTVLADNPSLSTRLFPGKSPVRIVIGNLAYDARLSIFDNSSKTIVINTTEAKTIDNNHWIIPASQKITAQSISQVLFDSGISNVIIEGGPTLHAQFIRENLWDEARIFTSPTSIQHGTKAAQINSGNFHRETVGIDTLTTAFNV